MKVRFRLTGAIEYLVIILIILDFNTPYSCALDTDYLLTQIGTILIAFLLFMNLYFYGLKRSILNRWVLYFVPYYLLELLLLFNSVGSDQIIMFVGKFLIVFPALVFLFMTYAEKGEMHRLLEKFVNIVSILAVISLFFWIFASQLGMIQPTSHIVAEWGGNYSYPMWFGVYTQRQEEQFFNFLVIRNQGIFCEAPMYNFVLIVALVYEMFLRNHAGDKSGHYTIKQPHSGFVTFRMILLIVTILSTVTTTGMIMLVVMFVLRYMLVGPRNRVMKIFKTLTIGIVGVAGLYLAVQIFLQKSTSSSWLIRVDDLRAGFMAFCSSPMFGTGFATFDGIDKFRSAWRFAGGVTPGFSNSIMEILGEGGLALGLLYLVPIIGSIWKSVRRKHYDIAVFAAVITILFSFTAVTYTFVMLMVLAFFNAYIIMPQKQILAEKCEDDNLEFKRGES